MKPVVAIVGRPNVGKSALFNRIIQERRSIVEAEPGVTRDRLHAPADWAGREFTLVDTGGLEPEGEGDMVRLVGRQARAAVEEADVLLFLLDGQQGVTPSDREVAQVLRHARKPVLLVVNKVDVPGDDTALVDFLALGLGEPMAVSALHGLGTGELLDRVLELLPGGEEGEPATEAVPLAVVGRPNVGKSSLVNALLGQDRVIVDSRPGTTRDAVDVTLHREEGAVTLIDTAGLRRRAHRGEALEYYSSLRTNRAIQRSRVALVVLDVSHPVTEQDRRIARLVHEAGRAAVILANKWDLATVTREAYVEEIRRHIPFMDYAPALTISALTSEGIAGIIPAALEAAAQHERRVSTRALNELVRESLAVNPPPRELRVSFVTQPGTRPPLFVFFVNEPERVTDSYRRYLENRIRAAFGFPGTPLRLVFRAKRGRAGRRGGT